jgi:hypothetical protein
MPLTVIDKNYFDGGKNLTYDPDSDKELATIIADAQTQINANTVTAGAAIPKATLTAANQILVATGAATPAALAVAASTIVGRTAAGALDDLSPADARTILNVEDGADVTDAASVAAAGAIMDGDYAGATVGRQRRTGVGTYGVTADNIGAAVDPTVNDDTTAGYALDSIWINTTAVPPRVFKCTNPAAGAAVWRPAWALNNVTAVVAPAVTDDDVAGYDRGSMWIDTALNNIYVCANPATGAAVWRLALNATTAGGELAGTYPNPTIADGVVDAANARAGALAGLVVDKGVPSSVVVAFDDGAGNADRPADGATYAFSINGVLVTTLTALDAPTTEDHFQRSSAGAEEADTILMAAAFAAAINAHSVLGLRVHADVYGGAGDGRWYVECRTILQADITAGYALTCALGGVDPGEVIARATAIAASKRQIFPFRYAVTAQDVLAGEIRFAFGCTAIAAYGLDVLTAVADYTRIAWNGAVDTTGGRLTIDNSGGTDWAAGNVLVGWVLGTVA